MIKDLLPAIPAPNVTHCAYDDLILDAVCVDLLNRKLEAEVWKPWRCCNEPLHRYSPDIFAATVTRCKIQTTAITHNVR